MNSEIHKIERSSSLLNKKWKLIQYDERNASYLSQKFKLSSFVGKLLSIRNIKEENTTKNLFTKMAYKKLTIISSTRIFEASS